MRPERLFLAPYYQLSAASPVLARVLCGASGLSPFTGNARARVSLSFSNNRVVFETRWRAASFTAAFYDETPRISA